MEGLDRLVKYKDKKKQVVSNANKIPRRVVKERNDRICFLYNEGKDTWQISEIMGMDRAKIKKVLYSRFKYGRKRGGSQ